MKDAVAVIVAGGKGLRFGGPVRKQYLKLLGRPLVWWSLKAFAESRSFGAAVLVVPADDVDQLRGIIAKWRFPFLKAVIAGGPTRADSVANGVAAAPPEFRWVAVHDAVRGLVTPEIIEKTLAAARKTGGAIAALPSRDTVKLSDPRGFIRDTPERKTVWLAQTPQIFRRSILEKALRRKDRSLATDDAQLAERVGCRVKLVEASPDNIKVTFASDLFIAKRILQSRRK